MAGEGLGLTDLPADWRGAVACWCYLGDQSWNGSTWVALNHWNYIHTRLKERKVHDVDAVQFIFIIHRSLVGT